MSSIMRRVTFVYNQRWVWAIIFLGEGFKALEIDCWRRETSPLRTAGLYVQPLSLASGTVGGGRQAPSVRLSFMSSRCPVLSWSPECEACCKHHERQLTVRSPLFWLGRPTKGVLRKRPLQGKGEPSPRYEHQCVPYRPM